MPLALVPALPAAPGSVSYRLQPVTGTVTGSAPRVSPCSDSQPVGVDPDRHWALGGGSGFVLIGRVVGGGG